MYAVTFLLLLVHGLIQYPQQVGDGLDEAALERMRLQAEFLNQQMIQLLQELEQKELEQKKLEQSAGARGALLAWQFWAVTGILILFLALWFGLRKARCHPDNSGHEERSNSNLVEEEEGHNAVAKKKIDRNNANVEDKKNGVGNEANASANEAGDDYNVQRNLESLLEEHIQLPVLDLDKGCSMIKDLTDKRTYIFGQGSSNSLYPVPEEAIGVGSTFEGWSPRAEDLVYRVLVPLSPPPGHTFHLELDTAGVLQRNFHVRVELLCTTFAGSISSNNC